MPELADFDQKKWKRAFDEIVQRTPQATRSWDQLKSAGIDAETLAGLLALACDFANSPGYQLLAPLLKPEADEIRATLVLAHQLDECARGIRSVLADKADAELIRKLEETSSTIRKSAADASERFSRRTLNPNFFLAWLFSELEEKSGKPCYRHVANLLTAAYMAHDQGVPDLGEDALRKMYARFRKSNPFAFLLTPKAKRDVGYVVIIAVILAIISQALGPQTSSRTP